MSAMKNYIRRTSESSNIGEIEKSGIADHIWKEKGNHLSFGDKVKIIDRDEPWRISHLKEWAHVWGYNDLLSGEIIVINTNGNQ